MSCETGSNNNTNSAPQPATQSTPDSGPVSESGVNRQDYGPTRHPAENAHDYQLRQQGQIGPCGRAWDYMYANYFNWKNGKLSEAQYREIERVYNACVAQNYR
ncbi:MAG TPA: hypothetical protein VGV59_09505 [Pyrinomonadaceae bacterium]|nr:hypothetical protein [Pyrinomonadaceae bacterium]